MLLHAALLLVLALAAPRAAANRISVADAVAEGNAHFRAECVKQQALMQPLLAALDVNDLSRSIVAYTAARPPYEQIETLANAFSDIDRDIDGRPYVFRLGEDDPAWQGFHLIERALYRDQRVSPDIYDAAVTLNNSVNTLCQVLTDSSRYTPHVVFAGSLALAYEVPSKKVASEEETWSDLSLMIFRSNYRGIWSQISPFFRTGKVSRPTKVAAKSAYRDVIDVLQDIDPDHPFKTEKGDARPYSTVTFPERKRIIDVAYAFAVAAEAVADEALAGIPAPDEGPEEEEEGEPNPIPDGKFVAETRAGLQYFLEECRKQQALMKPLLRSLKRGDLAKARRAYRRARPPYEQIEVLAGDFPELDRFIDGRPYVYEKGELDEGWRGFHEVERDVFRDSDVPGGLAATRRVKKDVDDLCEVLEGGIRGEGSFSAENTFAGMITLAYEVPAKKISSEEETWSDLSVMIFRENLKGIWSQFEPFKDSLPTAVFAEVETAYRDIRTFITFVVDVGNDFDTGVKFRKYSDVPIWARMTFSNQFYVLARSLEKARMTLASM